MPACSRGSSPTGRRCLNCTATGGCSRPTTCTRAGSTISTGTPNWSLNVSLPSGGLTLLAGTQGFRDPVDGGVPIRGLGRRRQVEGTQGFRGAAAIAKNAGTGLTRIVHGQLPLHRIDVAWKHLCHLSCLRRAGARMKGGAGASNVAASRRKTVSRETLLTGVSYAGCACGRDGGAGDHP